MAAVIERTGYVSVAVKERKRNIVTLEGVLGDCARSTRWILGGLAASLAMSGTAMSLLEGAIVVAALFVATVLHYVMDSASKSVSLSLFHISQAIVFGVLAGIVLKGIVDVGDVPLVSSIPFAVLTIAGLRTATLLGKIVTSE